MESFASKRIPKCIQLLPKKTKDIKTNKGLKNNQLWSIFRIKIRSLKRRRRLRLWCDKTIKVLPSNSKISSIVHLLVYLLFYFILFSLILNTSSFNFICYLINKSVYVFNVLHVYILGFFYLDLFFIILHLDRTCDNLILMCLICLCFFLVSLLSWSFI